MRIFSAAVGICLLRFAVATPAYAETGHGPDTTGIYEGIADVHTAKGSIVQAPEKFGYHMECYERNGVDARSAYTQWYFVRNRRTLAECLGLSGQLPLHDEVYYSRYGDPCSATNVENGVIVRRGPSYPQHNRIRCMNAQTRRQAFLTPEGQAKYASADVNRLPGAPVYNTPSMQPPPDPTVSGFRSAADSPNVFSEAPEKLVTIVRNAAVRNGINPRLLLIMVQVESGFNPNARSAKGAVGLLQLMPATAEALGVPASALRDPARNAEAGARYLKTLLRRYGNKPGPALAAYNAGPDAVDRAGGSIPNIPETQDYVRQILKAFKPEVYSVYLAKE